VIIYLLRHGKAGSPLPANDEARELTKGGVAALRAAAPLWRRLNLRPDIVLTSPLVRARQTAELLCEGIDAAPPLDDERLEPGAGWSEMARAIADHPDARRIMFVGHEPDLSRVAQHLSGAASVRMRKGGLACLEFPGVPEPGSGEIAWLLDPDLYAADGD
jgi:phosphohistidine phosphatase